MNRPAVTLLAQQADDLLFRRATEHLAIRADKPTATIVRQEKPFAALAKIQFRGSLM